MGRGRIKGEGGVADRGGRLTVLALLALALLALPALPGCVVSWSGFPKDFVEVPPSPGMQDVLYYHILPGDYWSGDAQDALEDVLRNSSGFRKVIPRSTPPEQGLFLQVGVRSRSSSFPAKLFGTFSVATYTILPMWSTEDGYMVEFTLYSNGEEVSLRNYLVRRKIAMWIFLIPFVWINGITPSEEEVFQGIGNHYLWETRRVFDLHRNGGTPSPAKRDLARVEAGAPLTPP